MLASAVSSSTPTDFQPSSHIGQSRSCPLMNRHTPAPGPTAGCPYIVVGMHKALLSAIGLRKRPTSDFRMLAFCPRITLSIFCVMPWKTPEAVVQSIFSSLSIG